MYTTIIFSMHYIYSLEIPLPLQEGSHLSGSQSSGQKCTDVLNSLLPTTVVEVATAAIVNHAKLFNLSTNKPSCMVEVISSLQKRIVSNQISLFGEKRKEASSDK